MKNFVVAKYLEVFKIRKQFARLNNIRSLI